MKQQWNHILVVIWIIFYNKNNSKTWINKIQFIYAVQIQCETNLMPHKHVKLQTMQKATALARLVASGCRSEMAALLLLNPLSQSSPAASSRNQLHGMSFIFIFANLKASCLVCNFWQTMKHFGHRNDVVGKSYFFFIRKNLKTQHQGHKKWPVNMIHKNCSTLKTTVRVS